MLDCPLEPRGLKNLRVRLYVKRALEPRPASISDDTITVDHDAVVVFTIDRPARSPRTTVRTRGTGKAPDL